MEVVALVVILAALYGVRSGYVGAKQTARKALKDWSAGTRPESTWGKRAGMATGGIAWAAFQGARGFKNSFGPGFWEGAQKAAAWAEQKKVLRTGPAQRIGKHAEDKITKRAKKVSIEKPKRARFDDPPPRPANTAAGIVHTNDHTYVVGCGNPRCSGTCPANAPRQKTCDPALDHHWWKPGQPAPEDHCLCGAKTLEGATSASGPSTPATPEPSKGDTHMNKLSDTTVATLTTFLGTMKGEMTAVADEAQGTLARANGYYSSVTSEIDGATAAGFKEDLLAPLTSAADAVHVLKEAQAAAAVAASDAFDAVQQAEIAVAKHATVVDAASSLNGGANAMADTAAYQDA